MHRAVKADTLSSWSAQRTNAARSAGAAELRLGIQTWLSAVSIGPCGERRRIADKSNRRIRAPVFATAGGRRSYAVKSTAAAIGKTSWHRSTGPRCAAHLSSATIFGGNPGNFLLKRLLA